MTYTDIVFITNAYKHRITVLSARSTLELEDHTLQSRLPAFRLLLQLQPHLGV